MTIKFRIDEVILRTTEGDVRYELPSDLTIFSGPTGVGKTTLLELVKYAFAAGEARLATVATDYVADVILDVTIGQGKLRLARSLDPKKGKRVRVTDLDNNARLPDHYVSDVAPSLNTLLLARLGLPNDMKAAAHKTTSSNAGSRVTFADIFKYVYVPQYAINRDIAGSQDSYYSPKRTAVFELLFGLTDPDILKLHSDVNVLNGRIAKEKLQVQTVLDFLRESQTTERQEAEQMHAQTLAAQAQAEAEREALREEIDPVIDRETQALRDLLTEAERDLANVRATKSVLLRQREEYAAERRRVQSDISRIGRMRDAGERLANIEFLVCPRCMQSLTQRSVPANSCRVCMQPDPVAGVAIEDQYETRQLKDQLKEMDDQVDITQGQLDEVTRSLAEREQLIRSLTSSLDIRTSQRVTPRLQAFSDASERLATARSQEEHFEGLLRQWDRVEDLVAEVERLNTQQDRLKAEIQTRKATLDARKMEIVSRLNVEFGSAVTELQIPAVESAGIDARSYLPVINGKVFDRTAILGGGSMTAIQIAYWSSLMAVALKYEDAPYPALLILDGPRLALNTAEDTSAAIYRRLAKEASANAGGVQIIVSDNELPAAYRNGYPSIEFDYLNPTVSTVRHPGKANVELLTSHGETT